MRTLPRYLLITVATLMMLGGAHGAQWAQTYGGASDYYHYPDSGDYFVSVVRQTPDEGYIAGGFTFAYGGLGHAWVMKLDANGSLSWQNVYAVARGDAIHSVQPTADGGYIVAGSITFTGVETAGAWLLKLDARDDIV